MYRTGWITNLLLTACLAGCGGGGGGSAAAPPANTGGGGGTSGGGATVVQGGLVPGGATLAIDTGATGVTLDVASGGTGLWVDAGDIQAFGSVILNGASFNTDSASFMVEGVPGSQADLRQGQQVLVIADAGGTTANGVHYRSNVKGPVTAVSITDAELATAVISVLGQTALTDAATTFSDLDVADIAPGDLIEVSGTLNDAGQIQASFIERKSSLGEYKATGRISAVSSTSFNLNALVVDYSSATLADFSGVPADGDVVEVKGDAAGFANPDALLASRVELLPTLTVGASVPARLEGYIDTFAGATDFTVQGAPVTTDASTVYVGGDSDSLGVNVKVQVRGVVDASAALLADEVIIQTTNAIRAEGPVESIDVAQESVTVLGFTYSTRALTRFDDKSSVNLDPLTLADLGVGDEVEVRGYLDGTELVATRLEREDPRDRARLRGPVTANDVANGTVDILQVQVLGEAGVTEYRDANDAAISQSEFHTAAQPGQFVKATWDVYTDTSQVVDELELED